jgi:hypothetical protein
MAGFRVRLPRAGERVIRKQREGVLMKIAMFSWETLHSRAVGGIAARVTELAAALERRGHEVHLSGSRTDRDKKNLRSEGNCVTNSVDKPSENLCNGPQKVCWYIGCRPHSKMRQ